MAEGKGSRKSRAGAPLPDIPDKLYFRIGEVARLLSLPAYVLRFWEGEFAHLRPYKGKAGQRLYRRKDVEALLEVRHLLHVQGFTIAGARQHLAEQTLQAATGLEPDHLPARASSTGSQASADVLLQVYTELRELSQVLSRPAAATSSAKQQSLLAPRKRTVLFEDTPSLFAAPQDEEEGLQNDKS